MLLALSTTASAQQPAAVCPSLPADSDLHWEQRADAGFIACRAVAPDGRQVLNVMLTARNPNISLPRALRQEEGNFSGEETYWYRPDLAGREATMAASRRITVVKLGKDQYAQVWINADTPDELATLRALAQQLDVRAASAALSAAND